MSKLPPNDLDAVSRPPFEVTQESRFDSPYRDDGTDDEVTHRALEKTMRAPAYSKDPRFMSRATKARLERDRKQMAGGKCTVCGNWRPVEECTTCVLRARVAASEARLAAFPPPKAVAAAPEEKPKESAGDPGELLGPGIPW